MKNAFAAATMLVALTGCGGGGKPATPLPGVGVGVTPTPSPKPTVKPSPSGSASASPSATASASPTATTTATANASAMCSIYAGSGALSFCYNFDETSGTKLVDSSGAGHNGTISASGVAFGAAGLTKNSSTAETTNGTTGSMTAGYNPAAGSFSISFFVNLRANPNTYPRLVATGNPPDANEAGFYIAVNNGSSNAVWADMGYGTGDAAFGFIPLALNTPSNVTLTYDAPSGVGTICVGTSAPACVSKTLPTAYIPSGSPVIFGGGVSGIPVNATFDEAAFFAGTALPISTIDTIGSYTIGAPSPAPSSTPVPTGTVPTLPTPSPQPLSNVAFNDWTMYAYDSQHDGFNPNTVDFSPSGIAGTKLHLAWQTQLNPAQAQPVVATNVAGHKALLIIGGYYSMYAYDGITGAQVWGPTKLGIQDLNQCTTSGVTGTPYYDAALGSVFVAGGDNGNPSHVLLYKLNAATGSITSQVDVTPTLLTGETTSGHTAVEFANGLLYIGTSSNCENSSWRGRIVSVDPVAMTVQNTFFVTYGHGGNFGGGGVWSWGGPSADTAGNMYVSSGNAESNDTTTGPVNPPFVSTTNEQAGYAEHLVKVTGDLNTVEDSNYPGFNYTTGGKDLDFAGTPVVYQPTGCDTLTATQGKGGTLVIHDTTNLANPLQYTLSMPSALANYIGNPGFSPLTQLLYAPVNSSQGGSLFNPGMVAIGGCGSSIDWSTAFGPDSFTYQSSGIAPRSGPTVTAGGVVFMGTPYGSSSSEMGALWALDATTGALLGNGTPLITSGDDIRMAPTVDGLWMWVFDHSGNLYGMTIDPSVPAVAVRRGIHAKSLFKFPL